MKHGFCLGVGFVGSFFVSFIGGWDSGVKVLLFLMVVDYVSGLIVGGFFKSSKKTESGGLRSDIGIKGLFRKVLMLVYVGVAYRIDVLLDEAYIRNAVIISFSTNEIISLTENFGLMGVPLPRKVKEAIDVLQNK